MRYFRKIIGERLYLSPVNIDDAEIYIQWMNDKAVSGFFAQYHSIVASKNEMKWLFEPGSDIQRYAIVLLDGDVMIGCISLQNIDHRNRNAFMGIFIGEEECRSKGYGAEAIRLLLDYGFHTMNLHNIMLSVHADNIWASPASKRWVSKKQEDGVIGFSKTVSTLTRFIWIYWIANSRSRVCRVLESGREWDGKLYEW